ncbi:MAG: hypothetical protein ACYC2P_13250 [Paludibacteraceae bacterium]
MRQVKANSPLHIENNPCIELVRDAVIEEYKTSKVEIQERLKNGQQITNLSIAFSVGIVSILQLIKQGGIVQTTIAGDVLTYGYLIAASLLSCFGLLYIGEDIAIGHLATYINQKLRPIMESMIKERSGQIHKIWEWEDFRNEQQFRMPMLLLGGLINSSKHILIIAPALLFFIAYLTSRKPSAQYTIFEIILIIAFVLVGISILILLIYETIVYRRISTPHH